MTKLRVSQRISMSLHWVLSLQISFVGYHEINWLQELDIGEILLYKRYSDDIFYIQK